MCAACSGALAVDLCKVCSWRSWFKRHACRCLPSLHASPSSLLPSSFLVLALPVGTWGLFLYFVLEYRACSCNACWNMGFVRAMPVRIWAVFVHCLLKYGLCSCTACWNMGLVLVHRGRIWGLFLHCLLQHGANCDSPVWWSSALLILYSDVR